jgi:hypothetical protein
MYVVTVLNETIAILNMLYHKSTVLHFVFKPAKCGT